jgi:hypothetical protein
VLDLHIAQLLLPREQQCFQYGSNSHPANAVVVSIEGGVEVTVSPFELNGEESGTSYTPRRGGEYESC